MSSCQGLPSRISISTRCMNTIKPCQRACIVRKAQTRTFCEPVRSRAALSRPRCPLAEFPQRRVSTNNSHVAFIQDVDIYSSFIQRPLSMPQRIHIRFSVLIRTLPHRRLKRRIMRLQKNSIRIRIKILMPKIASQSHKQPTKYCQIPKRRKLGINLVRQHLIKALDLTQPEGRGQVPFQERLAEPVLEVLEVLDAVSLQTSTLKISSGHLQGVGEEEERHARALARMRRWLVRILRYRRIYPLWTLQKGQARTSTLLRLCNAGLVPVPV